MSKRRGNCTMCCAEDVELTVDDLCPLCEWHEAASHTPAELAELDDLLNDEDDA